MTPNERRDTAKTVKKRRLQQKVPRVSWRVIVLIGTVIQRERIYTQVFHNIVAYFKREPLESRGRRNTRTLFGDLTQLAKTSGES